MDRAFDATFNAADRAVGRIGFGQVPGLDNLQRQASSRIGFGSVLGQQAQPGQIGFGSAPGGINTGGARPIGGYDDFLHGVYGDYLSGVQDEWNDLMGQMPGMGFDGSGNVTSPGGDWASVDQWDKYVVDAARKYGVPANLLKAIMRVESNGNPGATGAPGVVGLMQIYTNVWGNGSWNTNNAANIDKGAEILKGNYQQHGSWDMAIRAYLGFGTDMLGTTDQAYLQRVNQYWQELNSLGGGTSGLGPPPSGGSGSIASIFPQGSVHDWGEFNAPSGNGMYGYGLDYGMNGTNHTGLDIAMPIGSAYYAPMSGIVTCGGTGVGSGSHGGGCSAFESPMAGGYGSGRVELLLDNDAVLIFGHSQSTPLRPGMRVGAGMLLGYSGGVISPHIHLEARVRDPNTASGWRIVDPRSVLGGGSFSPQPGGYSGGGYGGQAPTSMNNLMYSLVLGRFVPGYN